VKGIVKGSMPIEQYALTQIDQSIKNLSQTLQRAARTPAPDAIHDYRVGIRRFSQGLLLFADFLPAAEVKQIKKLLKKTMDLTSEIRNRDIAIELLPASGHSKLKRQLRRDRKAYVDEFAAMIRQWRAEGLPGSWRSALVGERQ
jgi:CHAD domain-containing protein